MAINYVKGEMLEANLLRDNVNLAVDTDLLYLDVQSGFVGIKNTTPGEALDVTGNIKASVGIEAPTGDVGGITLSGGTVTSTATDLVLSSLSNNVSIGGNLKFTATTANIIGSSELVAISVGPGGKPYTLANILPAPASSYDASPAAEVPTGIYLKADGLKAFYMEGTVLGISTSVLIYEATLSIAHDMSSAGVATSHLFQFGPGAPTGTEAAHAITFNPDGSEVYVSRYESVGVDTEVEQYDVPTLWDLTSVTGIGNVISFNTDTTKNFAPVMSSDGVKAYAAGISGAVNYIREYDLSTAYNLRSASAGTIGIDKVAASVGSYDISADLTHASNYITVSISNDGTSIFASQYDGANNQIVKYNLSTAYDITTATLDESETPGTAGVVNSIHFKSDGIAMYWLDDVGLVYQYDTSLSGLGTSLSYGGTENLATTVDGPEVSGQLILPSYATALLPATTNAGGMVYDTDSKQVKVHDGTAWTNSGSPVGVSAYALSVTTTDATADVEALTSTGGRLALPDNTTWRFEVNIVARRTDANDESGGYKFTGVIDRNTGVATTAIVGVVAETIDAEDNAAWTVTVDADTTNGSLRVQVTGEAGKTVKWVAFVRTVEVSN